MEGIQLEILKAKATLDNLRFCVEQQFDTDIVASLLNLKDILDNIDEQYEEVLECQSVKLSGLSA